MKHPYRLLAAALILAAGSAQAGIQACDVDSDYDLRVAADRLEFSRHLGTPTSLVMRDGTLVVDGTPARLSAEDSRRVREFEREVRALLPEARAIAVDAADIAFNAMAEVVRGLADDPVPTLARLEAARAELVAKVGSADDTAAFGERFVAETIERLVGEIVPDVVGNVVGAALAAALSGDQSQVREIERRAKHMEREIETRVEGAARALERRAEALCPRIARLDGIDNALQYRLEDGRALELLRTDPGRR